MRARDIARPDPEDIASAERDLAIVRRQWQPPEVIGDASREENQSARKP
jgi:hypothetical protein